MKYKFTSSENVCVLEFLNGKISGLSKETLKKQLKQREIKINGIRIDQNVTLKIGDRVEIFVPAALANSQLCIVYDDDNIVIVDKPPLSDVEGGLLSLVKEKYQAATAVHRLDTNTRGLVIFAKNGAAEQALLLAFKNRTLDKKYRALIKGIPKDGIKKAYLFKDAKKSVCYVSDSQKTGYKQINTGIKVLESYQNYSDVELTLITGRTHQLRAHLAHLGCPIIGDDKYGDRSLNKTLGAKIQQLAAVSIEFGGITAPLEYLNSKQIALDFHFPDDLMQKILSKN